MTSRRSVLFLSGCLLGLLWLKGDLPAQTTSMNAKEAFKKDLEFLQDYRFREEYGIRWRDRQQLRLKEIASIAHLKELVLLENWPSPDSVLSPEVKGKVVDPVRLALLDRLFGLLEKQAKDGNQHIAIARVMGELSGRGRMQGECSTRALPIVRRLLEHGDPRVRKAALDALVTNQVPSREPRDALQHGLRDPDAYVRGAAAAALAGYVEFAYVREKRLRYLSGVDLRKDQLLQIFREFLPSITEMVTEDKEASVRQQGWLVVKAIFNEGSERLFVPEPFRQHFTELPVDVADARSLNATLREIQNDVDHWRSLATGLSKLEQAWKRSLKGETAEQLAALEALDHVSRTYGAVVQTVASLPRVPEKDGKTFFSVTLPAPDLVLQTLRQLEPELAVILRGSDVKARIVAAQILENMGQNASLELALKASEDTDVFVRWAAVRMLARRASKEAKAIPGLIGVLNDRDAGNRSRLV